MGKKRKRRQRRQQFCLIDKTNKVLTTSTSITELERTKKRFKNYTEEDMDIVTEQELTETLQQQTLESNALRQEQDKAYTEAIETDTQKERKTNLQLHPEERAKLFDALFLKQNPHYEPYLVRIKH
tara:strand:+ start:103 stop:480 length:378 start_codon:yes stop_codon:yes gene_type:complete